jgi:hypothetical protein
MTRKADPPKLKEDSIFHKLNKKELPDSNRTMIPDLAVKILLINSKFLTA